MSPTTWAWIAAHPWLVTGGVLATLLFVGLAVGLLRWMLRAALILTIASLLIFLGSSLWNAIPTGVRSLIP